MGPDQTIDMYIIKVSLKLIRMMTTRTFDYMTAALDGG